MSGWDVRPAAMLAVDVPSDDPRALLMAVLHYRTAPGQVRCVELPGGWCRLVVEVGEPVAFVWYCCQGEGNRVCYCPDVCACECFACRCWKGKG